MKNEELNIFTIYDLFVYLAIWWVVCGSTFLKNKVLISVEKLKGFTIYDIWFSYSNKLRSCLY